LNNTLGLSTISDELSDREKNQVVTPVNSPEADKHRGPENSYQVERNGFRLSPEWQQRLHEAGLQRSL